MVGEEEAKRLAYQTFYTNLNSQLFGSVALRPFGFSNLRLGLARSSALRLLGYSIRVLGSLALWFFGSPALHSAPSDSPALGSSTIRLVGSSALIRLL